MIQQGITRWLALGLVALTVGCSPAVEGRRLADPARAQGGLFFVEPQPKDTRHLDTVVEESLRAHGVTITRDRTQADFIVTYEDRWMWDMRMYLRDFSIEVRDAKTEQVVGSGKSHQDSLAAMGDTFRDVIDRAVKAMFE